MNGRRRDGVRGQETEGERERETEGLQYFTVFMGRTEILV
jgi:hypothetical protein